MEQTTISEASISLILSDLPSVVYDDSPHWGIFFLAAVSARAHVAKSILSSSSRSSAASRWLNRSVSVRVCS